MWFPAIQENEMQIDEVIKTTTLEPRPYQRRIVSKALDMFQGRYKKGDGTTQINSRSVMIESPTGSGKTPIGLLTAKMLQHEIPDLVVGWVSMRRNLLSQASRENLEKHINVKDIHFISMFDHNPKVLLDAKANGRPILLTVDESQHDAANSMAHLHNIIEPKFILGLSATPFRSDRVKLSFDSWIRDAGIHSLIQDEYLSRYHHYTMPNFNVETVAETYLRDPARWGKTLCYFVNLEKCYHLAHILRSNGIVCDVVTGDTDVESQLEAFKNGEIPVLINCMKLTEGFDSPDLQTAFVRDSGRGPTIQMGGRVFRKHPSLTHKNIVQSKETRWPFVRTALPEQQYVWQEESWLSLTVNPKINLINANARLAIATTEVTMPKFLVERTKTVRKLRF